MNSRIALDRKTAKTLFILKRISVLSRLETFSCSIPEYSDYLMREAIRSQNEWVAITWTLQKRTNGEIAAYMSLIADAIKLSTAEKEIHNLNYPFKTIPAMKIAKLAVSSSYQEKYSGIGSYMIRLATGIAEDSNEKHFACRFITVDADIEHNEKVIEFYQKNGFVLNSEMNNKRRTTISMRKDIYKQN